MSSTVVAVQTGNTRRNIIKLSPEIGKRALRTKKSKKLQKVGDAQVFQGRIDFDVDSDADISVRDDGAQKRQSSKVATASTFRSIVHDKTDKTKTQSFEKLFSGQKYKPRTTDMTSTGQSIRPGAGRTSPPYETLALNFTTWHLQDPQYIGQSQLRVIPGGTGSSSIKPNQG